MNKLSIQSNEVILSKIAFTSVYQKNILSALIESVSPHIKKDLDNKNETIHKHEQQGIFDNIVFHYSLSDFEKNPQNYSRVRQSLKLLQTKIIEIVRPNKVFIDVPLIKGIKWNFKTQTFAVEIDKNAFRYLRDTTRGYTLLQMKTVSDLSSMYAMKIYELLAKWRNVKNEMFYISVEDFRFVTNTELKYKQIGEFKIKVLNIAKEQLDNSKSTDLRFDYKQVKRGRFVIGFNIYITKTTNAHEIKKEENNLSPHWLLSKAAIATFKEIGIQLKGKNLQLIKEFCTGKKEIEIKNYLSHLQDKAMDKEVKNFPGYVINAIKNELNDKPIVAGTTTRSQTNIIDELAKMKKV